MVVTGADVRRVIAGGSDAPVDGGGDLARVRIEAPM
jgi:hypothetical protein